MPAIQCARCTQSIHCVPARLAVATASRTINVSAIASNEPDGVIACGAITISAKASNDAEEVLVSSNI